MQDIGEAQGGIWGRLAEAEVCLTQLQAIMVGQRREIKMLGGVMTRQLILELDQENRRKFERIERMLDPQGQTFGNLILIDLDPEDEGDAVTLVNE